MSVFDISRQSHQFLTTSNLYDFSYITAIRPQIFRIYFAAHELSKTGV